VFLESVNSTAFNATGQVGSTTGIVHVDMTLTRSKVKVTGLLNLRKLAKPCMLAAMTAAPLRGFLVEVWETERLHTCGLWSDFEVYSR